MPIFINFFIKKVYRQAIIKFAFLYLLLGALLYLLREFFRWLALTGFDWRNLFESFKTLIGL